MQKVLISELPAFAKQVVQSLGVSRDGVHATLLALRGELGAGKTTFVQALAGELGVPIVVQSPTYVLMKKYDTANTLFQTLVHIDAYRLEKPEDFLALKPAQFLNNPTALVVVEWPERVGTLLPKPAMSLRFSTHGAAQGERYIEVI